MFPTKKRASPIRLLLVNQYFWPDWAATAQLLGDLGRAAAKEGLEVTALAGRSVYAAPDGTRLDKQELWEGVRIHRVPCTSFGRKRLIGRISDYLTFLLSSTIWTLTRGRFDVVVCLSTPPLIAALGLIAKRRGAKFIYKVEDLYPDVAVALGALKPDSPLARVLGRISSWLLRSADTCVSLDEAMGEALRKRGAQRIQVIPNWADGEAIAPDSESGRGFRSEHDLPDKLTVLYSGNLGNAHRFDAVCEAMRRLDTKRVPIQFLFVGAGPRLEEVKAELESVEAVRFMPYQPRELLGELYNAADIHLITLREEVVGMLVPSKYAAALAAGKPVLLVGGLGTDLHSEIERAGVGWVCEHNADAVEAALLSALDESSDLSQIGRVARELFESKYSKETCVKRWLGLIRLSASA